MKVLSTVDEAIAHLKLLRTAGVDADTELKFAGELSNLQFVFEGPGFKHAIPGDLAKGIATYQEQIYRAAKYALYGRDGRFQLTIDQRKAFELVFVVNDGCTELLASVGKIVEALAAGVTGMDSTTLAIVIILVVLILVGGYVAIKIHDGIQNTKQKKIEEDGRNTGLDAAAKIASDMAKSQLEVVRALTADGKFAVAKRFEVAQEAGVKEILKSVPQATEVEVNGVEFDSDDIREIKRRARRSKSAYEEVTLSCKVFVDTNQIPSRLTISSPELPNEVKADWPDDIDEGKDAMLWDAIRSGTRIMLELGYTVLNGVAKTGVVIDVISPDEISANA